MRKIVQGKLYDTDKATLIYVQKTFNRLWYVTEKGNYFVVFGNGSIIPQTEEEVKEFLAEHDVDKYMELFGEVEEA